ncbi:MAG: nucleotidyltransferase domain-containing protein [Candidatus Bathyarchaeia archaeon]
MGNNHPENSRRHVAREAATLLYTLQEKEYKQAKIRAGKTLGVRVLPSNLEVAKELDVLAEEMEGPSRKRLLLQMRKEALKMMRILASFNARLVGSVWRGTAHHNSDIDIITFSSNPKAVLERLRDAELTIERAEWSSVTKGGRRESSFHIYLVLPSGNKVEVVVRSPDKMGVVERCEIYGDGVTGLNYSQLKKVLEEDPHRKFVPT